MAEVFSVSRNNTHSVKALACNALIESGTPGRRRAVPRAVTGN